MSGAYLDGHGKPCPKCGIGKLMTREIPKGEHKGKKYLSCARYPECDHREWPKKPVEPMEGHGKPCPQCGQGTMETREFTRDGQTVRFLGCSRYKEGACRHTERPVPSLPGHGDPCPKCGAGVLVTREVGRGQRAGERFLACTQGRPDGTGCRFTYWPPSE